MRDEVGWDLTAICIESQPERPLEPQVLDVSAGQVRKPCKGATTTSSYGAMSRVQPHEWRTDNAQPETCLSCKRIAGGKARKAGSIWHQIGNVQAVLHTMRARTMGMSRTETCIHKCPRVLTEVSQHESSKGHAISVVRGPRYGVDGFQYGAELR